MSRQGDEPADLGRLLAIMQFAAAIGIARPCRQVAGAKQPALAQ